MAPRWWRAPRSACRALRGAGQALLLSLAMALPIRGSKAIEADGGGLAALTVRPALASQVAAPDGPPTSRRPKQSSLSGPQLVGGVAAVGAAGPAG